MRKSSSQLVVIRLYKLWVKCMSLTQANCEVLGMSISKGFVPSLYKLTPQVFALDIYRINSDDRGFIHPFHRLNNRYYKGD